MKKTKNVTILVTVLNKVDTIKNCIESLLKVKYPYKRILIVDGHSSDGTYEILQKYENKIDLFQFSINHSSRLNWALDQIDTEFVALTDGDCVVDPHWLNELMKGFKEKGVVATSGYCGTPRELSLLQDLIGLELENRFKKFPQYISRAPTMNLCMKTAIARKVRFDKKQIVGIETDFGYRLTKFGKMVYSPKAKVFHYHRASLKNYFNQQKNQAMGGVRIFSKHGRKALADHITTLKMTLQIPLFFLSLVFLLLSFTNQIFLFLLVLMIVGLLIIYLKIISEISPSRKLYLPFLGLFFFRTFAWAVGILKGIILLFTKA